MVPCGSMFGSVQSPEHPTNLIPNEHMADSTGKLQATGGALGGKLHWLVLRQLHPAYSAPGGLLQDLPSSLSTPWPPLLADSVSL